MALHSTSFSSHQTSTGPFSGNQSSTTSGYNFSIQKQGNVFPASTIFGVHNGSGVSSHQTSTGPFGGNQSSTTSEFNFSIQKQGNVFPAPTIIGVNNGSGGLRGRTTVEPSVTQQRPSYVATREKEYPMCRINSISAMGAYIDKSHEELRWQTSQSSNKGDTKTSPTPNIFTSPSIFNHSSLNTPFQPFKSNIFSPPNTTISTTPPLLSPFSLSQPSVPPPLPTPTVTQTPNPFSSPIFHRSMLVNADQRPTISTTLTTSSVENFSSRSTQSFSYQPFKSNLVAPKTTNLSSSTTTTNSTISPSVNPFSHINLYPSQSQPSIPQPNTDSSAPSFPPSPNHSFLNICYKSTPSRQSTSVRPIDSWPFTPKTSQLGQTSEKVDSVSTNDQSQLSQASNGVTKVVEVSSQTMNGQQCVPSSLVANPFATGSPINQRNAVTSKQHGISSLPVLNNLSTNRRTASLLRIRHVASRHPRLPSRTPTCETKVPFFMDDVDKPGPFHPRANPRAWIKNSAPPFSNSNTKGKEDNETTAAANHNADILATMLKLPEGGYYTEPSATELAAKEAAEPGWCTRVNNFIVGRRGYGSIRLLGETDVRNLDLESVVLFGDREVIVYPEDEKKPAVGQKLNKACEITLLNVKCMDKKAGRECVEGPRVQRYKEMLMNKCREQGAEFVSYDQVQGEWKFRVQHF